MENGYDGCSGRSCGPESKLVRKGQCCGWCKNCGIYVLSNNHFLKDACQDWCDRYWSVIRMSSRCRYLRNMWDPCKFPLNGYKGRTGTVNLRATVSSLHDFVSVHVNFGNWEECIQRQIFAYTYKCLHQSTPIYLSELYIPVASTAKRKTESFAFSSARQPRRLILQDKAIRTKKFCLFRAGSIELTDPSL